MQNLNSQAEGQLHNLVSFHQDMSTAVLPHHRNSDSDILVPGQCFCSHGRERKEIPLLLRGGSRPLGSLFLVCPIRLKERLPSWNSSVSSDIPYDKGKKKIQFSSHQDFFFNHGSVKRATSPQMRTSCLGSLQIDLLSDCQQNLLAYHLTEPLLSSITFNSLKSSQPPGIVSYV